MTGMRQNQRGELVLGDVIVEIDGMPVAGQDDLLNALEQHQPGDTVKVVTTRGEERKEFSVQLAEPSAQ
jgi:S1-C subfamily serine protease